MGSACLNLASVLNFYHIGFRLDGAEVLTTYPWFGLLPVSWVLTMGPALMGHADYYRVFKPYKQ